MATNADEADSDSKTVTAQDLHDLKYGNDGVETSEGADETDKTEGTADEDQGTDEEDETNSDDQVTDDTDDTDETESDSSEFVKELPSIKGDTLEEYARNLEKAYNASTTEALRLKALAEGKTEKVGDDTQEVDTSDPIALFMKQKMDEEIQTAFNEFSKEYKQVTDPAEYNKFTVEVATLSNTILQSQKRMASPKELYRKAAVILGWEPEKVTDKDRLHAAIKGSGATSKAASSSPKAPQKSKVTDQMIALNRMMYPNKTDDQIRKELEPYVK